MVQSNIITWITSVVSISLFSRLQCIFKNYNKYNCQYKKFHKIASSEIPFSIKPKKLVRQMAFVAEPESLLAVSSGRGIATELGLENRSIAEENSSDQVFTLLFSNTIGFASQFVGKEEDFFLNQGYTSS